MALLMVYELVCHLDYHLDNFLVVELDHGPLLEYGIENSVVITLVRYPLIVSIRIALLAPVLFPLGG